MCGTRREAGGGDLKTIASIIIKKRLYLNKLTNNRSTSAANEIHTIYKVN